MQTLRGVFEAISSDKKKLLIVIAIVVISAAAVLAIVPHLFHTNMVYHILVHTLGLTIAVFLSAVSMFAYLRNGGRRLMSMTIGFLLMVVMELLYLSYSTMSIGGIIVPGVEVELSHFILFATLILFTSSILNKNSCIKAISPPNI